MPLSGYKAAGGGISPRTYYVEDDWDDNALSSRSNATAGAWFYQPTDSQPGDTLVGRYRPNWASVSGSISATNNRVEIPIGDTTTQVIATDSDVIAVTVSCDLQLNSTSSSGGNNLYIVALQATTLPDDGYFNAAEPDGNFNFYVRSGATQTTLINASWSADTNNHTEKVSRDDAGNFETFLDGTSQGTASDTTITTTKYVLFRSSATVAVYRDNLQIQ